MFAFCCIYGLSGVGFPSTKRYLTSSYYLFLSRYMFRSCDHLQVKNVQGMEINSTDSGSAVF
jgi:hypothetical protein